MSIINMLTMNIVRKSVLATSNSRVAINRLARVAPAIDLLRAVSSLLIRESADTKPETI